jgi:predicted transcriptional regulator
MDLLQRRIKVIRLALEGLTPAEIATHLGITPASVRRILRQNPDVHSWVMGPTGYINYPETVAS